MATNEQVSALAVNWNEIIAELIIKHEQSFVKSLTGTVAANYKKARVNFGGAFSTYLNNAFDKYSKVKTLLYRNAPRFLYEFYEYNDIEGDDIVIECDHVNSLLETSQFTIIEGDGGSGKSMLMRHLFVNALAESEYIPVFVELRNIEKEGSLSQYIYKCIKTLGFNLEETYFEYALKQGMFLFLLDGYDEIKAEVKDLFFGKLEEFCDMYCKNYFVLSSRRQGAFIGWQRFSVYQILPLSKKRALSLINKLDYDAEIKDKFYKKLSDELYESHKSFASNPLLLSIMLITFDQYAEIPEKLHVFYASAFDAMYSMHDATKGGYTRERKSNLTSDQFKNVFAQFCFRTYINGLFEFSEDAIRAHISAAGKGIPNFENEAFLDDLQVAICLIFKEGSAYQFTHRSFQEYFAAYFLNTLDDEKQSKACRAVLKISGRNVWSDNVFGMLKDMGEDRFEKNYIIPVLEEIEKKCPAISDPVQRYFFGLIKSCYFSADLKTLIVESACDMIFPMSGDTYSAEKPTFLGARAVSEEYATFILSTSRYYKKSIEKSAKKKLDTKYWERQYTPEEIWKDTTLRQHIIQQTRLGKELKMLSSLLESLRNHQDTDDNEFQKMLEDVMSFDL